MRNFIITIDGKQYQVGVEEVGATQSVAPVVTSVAPVQATPVAPTAGTKVKAPMPGMIKALKFEEGAQVKKGDIILILEAMKMDNDITAPCDGKVSYKTTKGSNVDTGALMAVIA
ncbi:MAG: biotin/lipoyl-binding protein [Clostridia bacterium]|nr:biotin/lipoyl-binding protein [Clostridia bacterium]